MRRTTSIQLSSKSRIEKFETILFFKNGILVTTLILISIFQYCNLANRYKNRLNDWFIFFMAYQPFGLFKAWFPQAVAKFAEFHIRKEKQLRYYWKENSVKPAIKGATGYLAPPCHWMLAVKIYRVVYVYKHTSL